MKPQNETRRPAIQPLPMTKGERAAFLLGWEDQEAGCVLKYRSEGRYTPSYIRGWRAAASEYPQELFLPDRVVRNWRLAKGV